MADWNLANAKGTSLRVDVGTGCNGAAPVEVNIAEMAATRNIIVSQAAAVMIFMSPSRIIVYRINSRG